MKDDVFPFLPNPPPPPRPTPNCVKTGAAAYFGLQSTHIYSYYTTYTHAKASLAVRKMPRFKPKEIWASPLIHYSRGILRLFPQIGGVLKIQQHKSCRGPRVVMWREGGGSTAGEGGVFSPQDEANWRKIGAARQETACTEEGGLEGGMVKV